LRKHADWSRRLPRQIIIPQLATLADVRKLIRTCRKITGQRRLGRTLRSNSSLRRSAMSTRPRRGRVAAHGTLNGRRRMPSAIKPRRFRPPWSVDYSPSTRHLCSIRISSAMLVRRVRHDTASRTRIWPSRRSSHCHSRLSVFVSPATVSWEASTSGRLYRRAFKTADWFDVATRKYCLSGGPPPPMRGVEEIIFQTLVMGRIYALRRARAAEPLKPDERRYHPRVLMGYSDGERQVLSPSQWTVWYTLSRSARQARLNGRSRSG